jgi:hypothetical protein
MAQSISQEALIVTGMPNAITQSRYVGATTGFSPGGGPWNTGDHTIDTNGGMFVCIAGGSPGTWVAIGTSSPTNVAGRNKIINGDFGIWQRGTSFSGTAASAYTADRWTGGSFVAGDSITQQTFTPGTAPIAGYEGTYFARLTIGSTAGNRYFWQKVEDVRVFAGQTATLSFWAKVSSGTINLTSVVGNQNFGSGGSSFVGGAGQSNTITTSWQRFTQTGTFASIAGKTIGTGSNIEAGAFSTTATNVSVDIWGVQLEAGPTATQFTTASGTVQGELALCQRYYETSFDLGQTPASNSSNYGEMIVSSTNGGFSTNTYLAQSFTTKKRSTPTVNIYNTRNASASGNSVHIFTAGGSGFDSATVVFANTNTSSFSIQPTSTSMSTNQIVCFGYAASSEL